MYLAKKLTNKLSLFILLVTTNGIFFSMVTNHEISLMSVKSGERRWAGGSLNKTFLQMIDSCFKAPFFVETGTYLGDSSVIAADVFEQVHTVELSSSLYERSCQRFINNSNIFLYCGDSAKVLKLILYSMPKKAVLWLDGHWSRGETARGSVNTPILDELLALNASLIKNHCILIDDIRFFQRSNQKIEDEALKDYPDLPDVINAIHIINPDYICLVYGDILIAHQDINITVTPIIKAMTISRLNQAEESLLLEAENTIMQASDIERNVIKELSDDFADDGGYGFNRYYHFWRALTLLKQDQSLAYYYMVKALDAGCLRAGYYLETFFK